MTDPEQVRRSFLQATLQRELQRATAEQERAIRSRLGGKRGRQLVRRLPKVEVALVFDTAHWVDVTQSMLRCWYDLTFVIAVGTTLDSRLANYSEKWGDEAAWQFASTHTGRIATCLEQGFIAIAAPAAQLPLSGAVDLLQEESSHIFRAVRSEIPELASDETRQALRAVVAYFV